MPDRREVHRARRHRREPCRKLARLAPAGAAAELAWNPEFLREGMRSTDTLRPERIVAECAPRAPRHPQARCTRSRWRQAYLGRHRLGHSRASQGRSERLSRYQDLLHQRDGRGLRSRGCGRHQARRDLATIAELAGGPAARPRVRRRLPAQGHPGLHRLCRRTGRARRSLSSARWTRSTCVAGPDGRPGAEIGGGVAPGQRSERARRRIQARFRRHPGLARARRGGTALHGLGARSLSMTRPPWTRHAGPPGTEIRRLRVGAAADADVLLLLTEWPSSARRTRKFSGKPLRRRRSLTGATRSIRGCGARPAGPTGRSAARRRRVGAPEFRRARPSDSGAGPRRTRRRLHLGLASSGHRTALQVPRFGTVGRGGFGAIVSASAR